jgi:hypothetical protein
MAAEMSCVENAREENTVLENISINQICDTLRAASGLQTANDPVSFGALRWCPFPEDCFIASFGMRCECDVAIFGIGLVKMFWMQHIYSSFWYQHWIPLQICSQTLQKTSCQSMLSLPD